MELRSSSGIVITAIKESADEIAALLDDGEIDIAMLATRRVHSDWCKVTVGEEEIVLCVPANSPLAARKSVSGRDLNELPMVLFSADFFSAALSKGSASPQVRSRVS